MLSKKKGFTLIELLVVIAIIGILASVVLVSLSTARKKAQDAKVKSNLASAKVAAEVYYDGHDSFSGVCADLSKYTSPLPGSGCGESDIGMAAYAPLNSVEKCWCVDGLGYQGEIAGGGEKGDSCAVASAVSCVSTGGTTPELH